MAAQATGEEDTVVQVEKEQGEWEIGQANSSRILDAVALYYLRLIDYVTKWIEVALSDSKSIPKFSQPLPVVIAGGTSLAKGFIPAFEKSLRARDIPFDISEVRHATDALRSVSRGCLLASVL